MKNHILFTCLIIFLIACKQETSEQMEQRVTQSDYYIEEHRPQFHFSPEANWMNDPNGMVYFEGEYHLFYQYYPDSTVWGPMHWGHAISKDLVHWEHLPIALYPDSLGYIFSGSAVVDWNNTTGFGEEGQAPLIAIFTHHEPKGEKAGAIDFQYQSIAYSNDKGRTWTKYEGNPVIPNPGIKDFRDPKVIWHEASNQWIMVFAAWDQVKFYGSPNLKNWKHLSDFGKEWGSHGGVWECPELLPLKVAGTEQEKWILLLSINPGGPNGGSATQYFIGDFDGTNFVLDPEFSNSLGTYTDDSGKEQEKAVWLDYGRDNYAGVTWSDISKNDGRRIFMGWMSNWDYAQVVPTEKWRSAMTIPRELILNHTPEGPRVYSVPVKELESLRVKTTSIGTKEIEGSLDLEVSPKQLELQLEVEIEGSESSFGIELSNSLGETYRIGFDAVENQIYSDRSKAGDQSFSEKFADQICIAPRHSVDPIIKMHLFLDVASAELFVDDGRAVMTEIFFPTEDFNKVSLYNTEGRVKLKSCTMHKLDQIWR